MNTTLQDRPASHVRMGPRDAFRTLLVHVQPEAAAQPRLTFAADLAHQLDATLLGVGAETVPASVVAGDPYGLMGGEWTVAMREQLQTNLQFAKGVFRTCADRVRNEWIAVEDWPAAAIAKISRSADLIIAGGSPLDGADKSRWCDPAELILLSGRPVLVVPPAGGRLNAGCILVAWKDTREARRALADSLPFLRNATEVVVMEICEHEDQIGQAEYRTASVVEHLMRHEVLARSKAAMVSAAGAADDLDRSAQVMGADLIVAGGYGHSRMNEWMFGGVTRQLLRNRRRFVLFSH